VLSDGAFKIVASPALHVSVGGLGVISVLLGFGDGGDGECVMSCGVGSV